MSLWKLLEGLRVIVAQEQVYKPPVERRNMRIPMTGIPEIDHDHMEIVRLLLEAPSHIDKTTFYDFSMHILDYLGRHVRQEERLMEQYAYPGLRLHRIEHRTLRSLVSVYIKPDGSPGRNKEDIVRECKEVFRHHIQAHDIPFADFVREKENV